MSLEFLSQDHVIRNRLPILRAEVVVVVKAPRKEDISRVDNISVDLVQTKITVL